LSKRNQPSTGEDAFELGGGAARGAERASASCRVRSVAGNGDREDRARVSATASDGHYERGEAVPEFVLDHREALLSDRLDLLAEPPRGVK
jgi:hypothetical protein